ncbi:MAG: hypothetical protein R2873_26340 [Caldilineaceae bacterium]
MIEEVSTAAGPSLRPRGCACRGVTAHDCGETILTCSRLHLSALCAARQQHPQPDLISRCGQCQLSVDQLAREAEELAELGVPP